MPIARPVIFFERNVELIDKVNYHTKKQDLFKHISSLKLVFPIP